MPHYIAILEDEPNRLLEMQACLDELLPTHEHCFFDSAPEMIAWLQEYLADVALISLDCDLPVVQYRKGRKVDPGNGRIVADFLAGQPAVCPVIVHTSNTLLGPGMVRVLHDAGWPLQQVHPYDDYEWVRKAWVPQVIEYIKGGWIPGAKPGSK
jgi:hypothetical protein